MKFIKTYEVIREREDKSLQPRDFIHIKYWRYKNFMIDFIMRLDKFAVSGKRDEVYYFTIYSMCSYGKQYLKDKFYEQDFTTSNLWGMIRLEDEQKILRPASPEEIEKFELHLDTTKYNL